MSQRAYFFAGEREEGIAVALAFGERVLSLSGPAHPDLITLRYELFSVDDARDVISIANQTPAKAPTKLIIVGANRIFHEAQNALLKVCEEPPEGTCIVLVVPSEGNIIPTLRSRLIELEKEGTAGRKRTLSEFTESFLDASTTEREKIVEKLLDRAKSDKPEDKQAGRVAVMQFVEDLIRVAYKKKEEDAYKAFLEDASHFIPILHERSAPLKPILEHLLIVMPASLGRK